MTRKKVIIACTRRRVSETIRIQLTELIGEYADVSLLVVSENSISGINCDLVVAISDEVAKWIAPFLIVIVDINRKFAHPRASCTHAISFLSCS